MKPRLIAYVDQQPFRIPAVACIAQRTSVMVGTRDLASPVFGSVHGIGFLRSPDNHRKSQVAEPQTGEAKSLTLIFGWALRAGAPGF